MLLEENIAEVSRAQTLQSKSAYSFSSGFTHLATTASVFAGLFIIVYTCMCAFAYKFG